MTPHFIEPLHLILIAIVNKVIPDIYVLVEFVKTIVRERGQRTTYIFLETFRMIPSNIVDIFWTQRWGIRFQKS